MPLSRPHSAFEIGAIRGIVPSGQLRTTYAREKARTHAAGLIGPPLGGLGWAAPLVVDAVTFLVAAIFYVLTKVPHRPENRPPASAHADGEEQRPTRRSLRREAGEAVAWLWCRRGLQEVITAVMILNLLGGAFLLPLIVPVGERGGDALTTRSVP